MLDLDHGDVRRRRGQELGEKRTHTAQTHAGHLENTLVLVLRTTEQRFLFSSSPFIVRITKSRSLQGHALAILAMPSYAHARSPQVGARAHAN